MANKLALWNKSCQKIMTVERKIFLNDCVGAPDPQQSLGASCVSLFNKELFFWEWKQERWMVMSAWCKDTPGWLDCQPLLVSVACFITSLCPWKQEKILWMTCAHTKIPVCTYVLKQVLYVLTAVCHRTTSLTSEWNLDYFVELNIKKAKYCFYYSVTVQLG